MKKNLMIVFAFVVIVFIGFGFLGNDISSDETLKESEDVVSESLVTLARTEKKDNADENTNENSTLGFGETKDIQLKKEKGFESYNNSDFLIERLIITPLEKVTNGVHIAFNVDGSIDEAQVIVTDSDGYLIGQYDMENNRHIGLGDEASVDFNRFEGDVDGLESGMTYQYGILVNEEIKVVGDFSIPSEKETTMLFFGDIQGYKQSQYDNFAVNFNKGLEIVGDVDLVYIAGDIVDDGDAMNQWNYLENSMKDYFKTYPFVTAIGNHDVKGSSAIYESVFTYPPNGYVDENGEISRNYYIDLPYGRIAQWDTEAYKTFEEQSKWLSDVMNEVEGFKIVLMHRSVYPMSYDEGHIRALAQIFEKNNIDLVLSGHDHIYNRTTMYEGQKQAIDDGVTYIVSGSGSGSKYYEADVSRYWTDVVYDNNEPIFIELNFGDNQIIGKAYSTGNDEIKLIDEFVKVLD